MSHETVLWLRFIPLLVVVTACLVLFVRVKRRGPLTYPPGRGLRLFDKDGNEVKGPIRIVTAIVLAIAVMAALVAVVLPFTIP